MIFDEAGTYQIEYTATDDCGNETVAERTVIVEAPPRTVLYTDGTLIINELSRNIDANIALHGQPTNIYDAFDPNGSTDLKKYIFTQSSSTPWYSQRTSITKAEIGSQIQPTSTAYWFSSLSNCASINLTNLDTSLVTTMNRMFSCCSLLTTLDVSNLDTSQVLNMSSMFGSCSGLTTLDVSGFNTNSVTTMYYMFSNCSSLAELDLSNFNTSNVTSMSNMFYNCSSLTTLDLSNFNTSLVSNMSLMFGACSRLASLDISGFDTSAVTNMSEMFTSCSALTSLDLSSFNTALVTNMSKMFNNCRLITTIYASTNFVVTQVTSSSNMFYRMSTSFVGGAGTVWSSSYVDKTRAKIDGGTADPGYFTANS